MQFEIEKIPPKEWEKAHEQLSLLRMKLQASGLPLKKTAERRELVDNAILENNIALLYWGYGKNRLSQLVGSRLGGSGGSGGCRVDFGNTDSQRSAMSSLCMTLARLTLDVISSQGALVKLYDDITTFIEQQRINKNGIVLYEEEFWKLFFAFYEMYHEQKAIMEA